MSRKNIVVFLVLTLLIAVLFLLPNSVTDSLFYISKDSPKGVLVIRDIYGFVQKKNFQTTELSEVGLKTPIAPGDTLYTHADSKVLLSFKNPFWLMPHSKMEFAKHGERWVAQLVYGEIKKLPELQDDTSPSAELIFATQAITTDTFSSYDFEPIDIDLKPTEFKEVSAGATQPQNIIEKQIFETLGLHKKFFEGCFIRLYKKNKGQLINGETVFELTIDVTGAISNSRIVRSDIQDDSYTKCLRTVLERVRFRNLPLKEPMLALFPLSIEAP